MSIELADGQGGKLPYSGSSKDLKADGTFTKAAVSEGTWIMYTYKNFNDEKSGGSDKNIMILDKPGTYDVTSNNGSMFLLSSDTSALTLFKHVRFGGVSPDPKAYDEDVYLDITKDFTAGSKGASSGIVGNGNRDWDMFLKVNCEGVYHTLTSGQRAQNFIEMGINDQVKSLRKK